MILAVDVGNTDATIGLWDGSRWLYEWRVRTFPHEPVLYYEGRLRDFFLEAGLKLGQVEQVVMSSVVPPLTPVWKEALTTLFGPSLLLMGPELYERLPVQVLNPYEIGSDLVSNAMAAYCLFPGRHRIVVDFGTALTFTTVSQEGEILGVAIAPGLKTAMRSLFQNTARLPEVPLELPESALGKSTPHAIQSGVLIGYVGLVQYMLVRIRQELPATAETAVVGTGGLVSVLPLLHPLFEGTFPYLTLDGLRLSAEWMSRK